MARRRRRMRWASVATAAVVLGCTGTAYAVTSAAADPRYRTTTATTATVEETLASSGIVDAAQRADLGFGTDGTLARLEVALGDTVKAGQVIAVLATGDLDAAVTKAKASVAQAVAQLAADRSAQSSSVKQAANPTTPTKPSGTGSDPAATAALLKKLAAAQDAVVAAQSAASQALALARTALATQSEVCATANAAADSDADADAGDQSADACAVALAEVQARQQDVSDAQDTLAGALEDLAGIVTRALGSLSSNAAGSSTGPATGSSTGSASNARTSASTSADSSTANDSTGSSTVTAARLASDQAQIEQAKADLVSAEQARAQATLRSTRSGKVVALDAAVGDSVSAGDTVATVIGGKAVTIAGTVSETQLGRLKVGLPVRVSVPGATTTATGTVTAIGLVADTSSGTTAYPFTVTVEDPSIALPTGSRAMLQIVLSTAEDVVTVPTSAVVRDGDSGVIRTWDGSALSRKTVKLGAIGVRTVQVTSGLKAGDQVVLAAIDDPIKDASSEVNNRGGFAPMVQFSGPGGGGRGAVTFSSGSGGK